MRVMRRATKREQRKVNIEWREVNEMRQEPDYKYTLRKKARKRTKKTEQRRDGIGTESKEKEHPHFAQFEVKTD